MKISNIYIYLSEHTAPNGYACIPAIELSRGGSAFLHINDIVPWRSAALLCGFERLHRSLDSVLFDVQKEVERCVRRHAFTLQIGHCWMDGISFAPLLRAEVNQHYSF